VRVRSPHRKEHNTTMPKQVHDTSSRGEDLGNQLAAKSGDTSEDKARQVIKALHGSHEPAQAKDNNDWSSRNPQGRGGLITAEAAHRHVRDGNHNPKVTVKGSPDSP
jgi:hypothetical protein